jgi:hypothetical protein
VRQLIARARGRRDGRTLPLTFVAPSLKVRAPIPHTERAARLVYREVMRRLCISLVAFVGFVVLATTNAAGYRYGVGDQLHYVPSLLRALDPTLFPRDGLLLDAQGNLMLVDELLAAAVRLTGVSLPLVMLCGYALSLALLLAAGMAFARPFLASWWSVAAFCPVLTLRHRIAETSTNTLEGNFHPRVLAFAVGISALAVAINGLGKRPLASWLVSVMLVIAAGAIHPLAGSWFGILLWGHVLGERAPFTRSTGRRWPRRRRWRALGTSCGSARP